MKKYITICVAVIMIILVSCSKSKPDNTVKVWMYRYSWNDNDLSDLIKNEITNYAAENNIDIEILEYKQEELSLKDYKLKRNLALETDFKH